MVQANKPESNSFLAIKTNRDLANYLGIPVKEITFFAYSKKDFYSSFEIKKKDPTKYRAISAPKKKLKAIQTILAKTFNGIYDPPRSVHGFVSGRSTASNALGHTRKRSIAKIDLLDFFPSITAGRIRGLFKHEPFSFPDEVADTLTNLTTHNGSLPQGAPTSPILSNMICRRMDKELSAYARTYRLKYSRYADDLTFSSTSRNAIAHIAKNTPENEEISIYPEFERIINSNGFKINNKKTGIYSKGTRQVVTGIVVNEKCNFRRSDYRFLRVLFSNWKKLGIDEAAKRYVEVRKQYAPLFYRDDNFIPEVLPRHVKGLLCYYTMIANANKKQSIPLQKLWTSFHDLTGDNVPLMLPERSIISTSVLYDFRYIGIIGEKEEGVHAEDGSGFLLADGRIITALHCLKPLSKTRTEPLNEVFFEIKSNLGCCEQLPLKDISPYSLYDCAIFQAKALKDIAPGIPMNTSYLPQKGETVMGMGYADGHKKCRTIAARIVDILENGCVVVDRAFIHGMSGGPVLNSRGEVIGLITKGSGDYSYDVDGEFQLLGELPCFKCVSKGCA